MKFKLGQKVNYVRISRKIEIDQQYWEYDDFEEDEEKTLKRRESIYLDKIRIGYIVGRRKLVFNTIFEAAREEGDYVTPDAEWVKIKRQEYRFFYMVAYTMGKTNYVLEMDLSRRIQGRMEK